MPLRDYELVQKAKQEGWVKISAKWLLTPLTCDPVACQGRCCRKHSGNSTAHYHPDELWKVPGHLRHLVLQDGSITCDSKGNCNLIPHCMSNPNIIPTECRLFPLGFSKWERLIIKKPAWTGMCPAYRKGEIPVYVSMKQCLVEVFGEEVYSRIVEAVESSSEFREEKYCKIATAGGN